MENKCSACGSTAFKLLGSHLDAKGRRHKRFSCNRCFDRWSTVDGVPVEEAPQSLEQDWRVKAHIGCRLCLHCVEGYCSLGVPEAGEPGFVSECVARADR